jgi:hypothetical protein
MKKSITLVAVLCFLATLINCSSPGKDEPEESNDEAVKVCTLMPIYCPSQCHQSNGGCPVQCHCPGYNACGPSLKCGEKDVCCTGAGPVNANPALNTYSCNPAGTACPL